MTDAVHTLIDHLFRHRSGQMVATLTRIFGAEHLSLAEEVVQDALIAALQQWSFRGLPDNPSGWLFQVARNRALDHLRRETSLRQKEREVIAAFQELHRHSETEWPGEINDDQLRMMLLCCHPSIPEESRIALTLKTVCAFSVDEIARAFLVRKETIAQRIVRAKRSIREQSLAIEMPPRAEIPRRLDSLLKVLYLMFNEGYGAHEGEELVRADLCQEAIRLTRQLVEHAAMDEPETHALLSLMLLQAARIPARTDLAGELAVLSMQDRSLWNRPLIAEGLRHLDASARGERLTRYHVEAAIASCHAVAPTFEDTDWRQIVEHYDDLMQLEPSPVVGLNRAIAVAMLEGPAAAIDEVERLASHSSMTTYLPLAATLGELWLRRGDRNRAAEHFTRALELPASLPEKRFLLRKLNECR